MFAFFILMAFNSAFPVSLLGYRENAALEEWHIGRWKQSGWENTLTWRNSVLKSFTEADIFNLAEMEWHVMFSVRVGFSCILIF